VRFSRYGAAQEAAPEENWLLNRLKQAVGAAFPVCVRCRLAWKFHPAVADEISRPDLQI
jgi:hypothetical protein